jgi:hypothetical protein
LERRERELRLALDAGDPSDPKVARGGGVIEQGGLADPRFSVKDQHGPAPVTGAGQDSVEHLALASPTEKPTCRRENRR